MCAQREDDDRVVGSVRLEPTNHQQRPTVGAGIAIDGRNLDPDQGLRGQAAHAQPVVEGRQLLTEGMTLAGRPEHAVDLARRRRPEARHLVRHVGRIEAAAEEGETHAVNRTARRARVRV